MLHVHVFVHYIIGKSQITIHVLYNMHTNNMIKITNNNMYIFSTIYTCTCIYTITFCDFSS